MKSGFLLICICMALGVIAIPRDEGSVEERQFQGDFSGILSSIVPTTIETDLSVRIGIDRTQVLVS